MKMVPIAALCCALLLLPAAAPSVNTGAAASERFANPPSPDGLPRLTQ